MMSVLVIKKVRYEVSCDDKQRMPNNIEASFDKQVKKLLIASD